MATMNKVHVVATPNAARPKNPIAIIMIEAITPAIINIANPRLNAQQCFAMNGQRLSWISQT